MKVDSVNRMKGRVQRREVRLMLYIESYACLISPFLAIYHLRAIGVVM